MREDDLQRVVLDLCRLLQLRTAHFRPARSLTGWRTPVAGDGAGFPDLVIVGPGGVLFRELKSAAGPMRAEQIIWRDMLLDAGANWRLWTPARWADGSITRELNDLRRKTPR